MNYLSIFLAFWLGLSFLNAFVGKFSLLEILGFSFPAGMGIVTLLMFLLDILGIEITFNSLLTVVLVSTILFNYKLIINAGKIRNNIRLFDYKSFFYTGKFNLVWLTFIVLIVIVVAGISIKNLYWPTVASDAISSFDLYGKVIAAEGKLMNSLIYEKSVGYGAAYPPLYALSLAYSYIFGFETSKIIPALYFISFVISFYSLMLRNGSALGAVFVTFFLILSPEFLAQSAINITSVPQAIYGSLGIISIITWYNTSDKKYLFLSVLMLAFNGWIRSEGIVYIGAGFLLYAYVTFRRKEFFKPFIFLFISVLPFLLWQVFLKMHSDLMNQFVQVEINILPNLDTDYIFKILNGAQKVFFSKVYYGITIYAFMFAIILNMIWVYLKKDTVVTLIIVLIPIFAYLFLLNQLVLRADTIENIMAYSAKRFFFGFIILMWFYFGQIYPVKNFFSGLEGYLGIPKKIKK